MLGNLISAAIKVVVTPVAVVKDVIEGEPLTNTADHLESALDDLTDIVERD